MFTFYTFKQKCTRIDNYLKSRKINITGKLFFFFKFLIKTNFIKRIENMCVKGILLPACAKQNQLKPIKAHSYTIKTSLRMKMEVMTLKKKLL